MSADRPTDRRARIGLTVPARPDAAAAPDADRATMIAADIFGVLIDLDTGSWRSQLARIGELTEDEFMSRWQTSGLGEAWDTGALTVEDFAANLRDLLEAPSLTQEMVAALWVDAVGTVDPVLGPIVAKLSREGRLILASNHNPLQWPVVHRLLTEAGISRNVPAVLSHQVGAAKPNPAFYTMLAQVAAGRPLVFLDDRMANVEAAAVCGLNAFHHTDPARTAAMLTALSDRTEPA